MGKYADVQAALGGKPPRAAGCAHQWPEVLLHALEEKKIYVSTGSACSAHKKGKNRILNAMGVTGERQEGAIRFSFSAFNTPGEMDETAAAIADLLGLLRRFKRR